jgi:EAL domain-containing protein (putative c-di-GMP-specific phosphodiesterase class I)/CheY-like chemotaxis protein
VVDDDADLLAATQRTLERAGYEVTTASDGMEAIGTLGRGDFDLVVSDIDMPRLDGLGLLRAVRDAEGQTPFIFVTGQPRIDTAIFAVNNAVAYYLTKPFEPDDLVNAAKRAVGARRLERLRQNMAQVVNDQRRVLEEEGTRFGAALERLYLAFQPIVHWPTRTVFGHEALARTREPSVPNPGVLFQCAEHVGETDQLSRAIRRKCAEAIAQHPGEELFFVNLHSRDLRDPELSDPDAPLTKFASRVVLEVAERASIDNIKEAAARLDQLRALGFRIAVDDIGSGYAGLNSFALLEPDVVKLDMALVRDVDKSVTKQRLIESFVTLCKAMNIEVIAEGIETEAELETLSRIGCELYQGFLLARPEPRLRTSL